jgi:hypothetical protein
MNPVELVDRVLSTLTPQKLREVILAIAQTQAPDDRESVTIGPIMEALTGTADLGSGPEAWQAYLKLREGIKELVAGMEGMQYVEADS